MSKSEPEKKTPGEVLRRAVETGEMEGIVPPDIKVAIGEREASVRVDVPRPDDWEPRDTSA
jgi:hypothetical protein